MRYLVVFLFLINCSTDPTKEDLIEYCADMEYTDLIYLNINQPWSKVDYASSLWKTINSSFKEKYDNLYKYRYYTQVCERKYNKAPVDFKLRYQNFRKNSKKNYEKTTINFNKEQNQR